MTPSGIEPATFWFVAQYFHNCATVVPTFYLYYYILLNSIHLFFNIITLLTCTSCASLQGLILSIPVVLKTHLPIKYLHVINFPYHQVLFATVGNAVVTSAFVYIKCRINSCNNNNRQEYKSKNVSLGRENNVSDATFRTPGRTLSTPSHVACSYYIQQDTRSVISNAYWIPVLQS
jgi:hypothetical protein